MTPSLRATRPNDARSGGHSAGLPADSRAKLSAFLDLLVKWNRVYNLTAIRDRARMETHHIQDALAVLPYLPDAAGARVLDVGSGGGIPGIPLAIARPDTTVVVLDANGKKAAFLAQAVIELGLRNVRAVVSRVEDYVPETRFDVVISRAFSDLQTFVRAAMPHLAADGIVIAMKGALSRNEIDALPREVVVMGTPKLAVPGVDAERHLVIVRPARERA